mgnify:CR=1 FL=1
MADAPIWEDVVDHLVDALAGSEQLGAVQVIEGLPGDLKVVGDELVAVDDEITSETSMPVATAGAKPYDDIFEVLIRIRVRGRSTRADTRARLGELHAAIHELLAGDPTLGDLDGVLSAAIVRRRRMVTSTTDGFLGYGEVYLSVHSRITP